MDREVYAFTGSPSYTASEGVEEGPVLWGRGAGFYDGGWGLMRTWTPPDGEPDLADKPSPAPTPPRESLEIQVATAAALTLTAVGTPCIMFNSC